MNSKYNDLFDLLITSYNTDDFDDTLIRIMGTHEKSPQETFEIITSLCGVNIPYDNNYLNNLKKSISNYVSEKNSIKKLIECDKSCSILTETKLSCQLSCPYGAIYFDILNKSTFIDYKKCTNCGSCIASCKSGKILDSMEFLPLLNLLNHDEPLIAIMDPSFCGQFGSNIMPSSIREALISIGFTDMIEVAIDVEDFIADIALEWKNLFLNFYNSILISSYCPLCNNLAIDLIKESNIFLSSFSPIVSLSKRIKTANKDMKIVYIGPCTARKLELHKDYSEYIDFVLTFQELYDIFRAFKITLSPTTSEDYSKPFSKYTNLCIPGTLSEYIYDYLRKTSPDIAENFKPISVSGFKNCKDLLGSITNPKYNFVECFCCINGCLNSYQCISPSEESIALMPIL